MKWTNQLSTGNESIDNRTKTMADIINHNLSCFEEYNCGDYHDLDTTISFLEKYIDFSEEEAFEAEKGCPELEKHKEEHRKFINTIKEIIDKYDTNGKSLELIIAVNRVMAEWYTHHIMVRDLELSKYLRNC